MMKISCREASRLLSQAMDRRPSMWQQAQLRLHLTLCDACRNFDRQLVFLRRAIAQLFEK